jgi:hypothetical protein
MTVPQKPDDQDGSRTAGKSGKKKPATEAPAPANELAQRPVSEMVTRFVEQDDREMEEEEYDDAYDGQSSESEEEPTAEGAQPRVQTDPAGRKASSSPSNVSATHPTLSRPPREGSAQPVNEVPETEADGASETSSSEENQEDTDEADEELIQRTLDTLYACVERTGEDRYQVATDIVNDFLDGDFKAASDKNPWKTQNLKKLRDHKRLPIQPQRLGEWIRLTGCRAGVIARNSQIELNGSTWLELIAINDEEKRYELALEAHNKGYSVRQTRKRVLEINSKKVDPKLADKLLAKIKDPRSIPVAGDYEKMIADEQYLTDELSKKERLLLRAEIDTKRDQIATCGQFLDLLEQRLADVDL